MDSWLEKEERGERTERGSGRHRSCMQIHYSNYTEQSKLELICGVRGQQVSAQLWPVMPVDRYRERLWRENIRKYKNMYDVNDTIIDLHETKGHKGLKSNLKK